MKTVGRASPDYPGRLREIPGPPKTLYFEGRLPVEERASVAIIGARDCSEYGRYVASRLGALMGKNGVQVISGMARGIDGIAQAAALEAGGSSFAVLGCGVDICYPTQNRELYERLRQAGGILSEYPPGTPARPGNFPPRNRIVSGLADAVIVVEAREKSGTLITVDMALEQGREVFAVPGRVTDNLSAGCNRLLRMGAGVLADEEEFMEELREIAGRRRVLFGAGFRAEGEDSRTGEETAERGAFGEEGENSRVGEEVAESGGFRAEGEDFRAREETAERGAFGEEGENSRVGEEVAESGGFRAEGEDSRTGEETAERGGFGVGEENLRAVFRVLDLTPRSVEEIRQEMPEHSGKEIAALLIRLCMEKRAVQVSPGRFCRGENG